MLSLALLLFSLCGYYAMLYILLHGRKTALYPSIVVSLIMVVGFFAGMFNCLKECFICIFLAGFILVPLCTYHLLKYRSGYFISFRITLHAVFPFIALVIGSLVLYTMLEGRFLHRYDDFSHWGQVARIVSTKMRFPNEKDLLEHASYLPGSGIFIAYVSSVIGISDGSWFFSQAFMLLSFWLSLLCASSKVSIQSVLVLSIIPFMHYNVPIDSLHVDNLLAAGAFASIMACVSWYRLNEKYILLQALILCTLVMIKNSGVFLAAIVVGLMIYQYVKKNRKFSAKLIVLMVPFLLFVFWNVYADRLFVQEIKHQISTEYYLKVLNGKTAEDIRTTFSIILPRMVNPLRNHALLLVPGYLFCYFFGKSRELQSETKRPVIWFALILFVVYEIGILLMYILSMPMNEVIAQNGEDYARYNGTIVACLAALLLYLATPSEIPALKKENIRNILQCVLSIVLSVSLVCLVLSMQTAVFRSYEYRTKKNKTAYQFAQMQDQLAALPDGRPYIVLFDEQSPDSGYDKYMSRYYLRSKDITRCYDYETAYASWEEEPWRYYIDLATLTMELPNETVGVELFTHTENLSCQNVLDVVGYKENSRYSISNSSDDTAFHWDVTGYITAKVGDTIYLKNVEWYPSAENGARGGLYWFYGDKTYRSNNNQFQTAEGLAKWKPVFDAKGNVIQLTVPKEYGTTTMYLRIVCQDINSASVITVNEPIE